MCGFIYDGNSNDSPIFLTICERFSRNVHDFDLDRWKLPTSKADMEVICDFLCAGKSNIHPTCPRLRVNHPWTYNMRENTNTMSVDNCPDIDLEESRDP